VLIFRDRVTNEPKGFGFVHFATKEAQKIALSEDYNHIQIKGRACRVRSEQKTTLFVGNIPKTLTVKDVHDSLYQLCPANMEVELKTGPPPACESRGFAFVTFGNHQTADKSRKVLVSAAIKERPLNVSWAEPQEDADADTMASVRTLYISNLHANVTDNVLGSLFSQYGVLVNCAIVKNPQTKESRGFAFVEFKTRESCVAAMDALNGAQLESQPMTIVLAKPPPKPSKSSDKGCYRCGGEGHISRDCPNNDGGDDRKRKRDRGGRSSSGGGGGGGGGQLRSAPQFNSSGQMNPYIYDPETQQYTYLEQGQWNRLKRDLGLSSPGPDRNRGGRDRGGRDRGDRDRRSGGNGGGGGYQQQQQQQYQQPAATGYYQGYDYSAYQQPGAYAGYPQYAYTTADYSQQTAAAAQPAATATATSGTAAAQPQQYAQHTDYAQTRYAPY